MEPVETISIASPKTAECAIPTESFSILPHRIAGDAAGRSTPAELEPLARAVTGSNAAAALVGQLDARCSAVLQKVRMVLPCPGLVSKPCGIWRPVLMTETFWVWRSDQRLLPSGVGLSSQSSGVGMILAIHTAV